MPPPFLQKSWHIILDIIFPPICLSCGKYLEAKENQISQYLCLNCFNLIELNHTLFCPICRARLAYNRKVCHKNSPFLLGAAGSYGDPLLQHIIHRFKYEGLKKLSPVLGKILIAYLKNIGLTSPSANKLMSYILIPIPLHKKRERKRGFNQSELLAKEIGEYLKLPVRKALFKIKNNKAQVGLENIERIKNVRGCFEVRDYKSVQGKNIILVDDVFTSGATINEAVRILKSAGAKKIIALVLAKA